MAALASVVLGTAALGAGAGAAVTTNGHARVTTSPRLSELIERLRRKASAKAPSPGAASHRPTTTATTPTTTYAPPGNATTTPGAAAAGGTAAPGATRAPPATTAPSATTPGATTVPPTATTPATVPGRLAAPAQTPASKAKASGGRRLSAAAIAIVTLAALLVLGCLSWALARNRAYEPRWLVRLRHACAEAGFRASATWSEFADWARLGR